MSYSFQSYALATPRSYDSSSNLQYAFAIKDFAAATASVVYFDLLVLKTYQSSLVVNFIYEPNKWKTVSYNYWIAFRKDLSMFIETYTDQQFSRTNQSYRVVTSLDRSRKSGQAVAVAFLLGLRYKRGEGQESSHSLSFSLVSQTVDQNQLTIQFESESPVSIESVTLSFVVYEPSQVNFGSYGGTVAEANLQGAVRKNLRYLFPNLHSYCLFGLSALTSSDKAEDSITYNSSVSGYYDLSVSVEEWEQLAFFEITYLVAGMMPAQICSTVKECQAEGLTYIHGEECVSVCPASSRVVKYADGAVECQECPPNQLYSYITNRCECRSGFSQAKTGGCEEDRVPLAVTNARASNQDTLDGDSSPPPTAAAKNCLTLDTIQQSNKNIFVTLKASPAVSVDKHSSESEFIRISFPSGRGANSYYCNQCSQDGTLYECLLLFASGVPKEVFSMLFECSTESGTGRTSVCSLQVPYKSSP